MSSRRLQDIFKMSSRRLQDIFKISSKRLQDILQKRLQNIFKTFWRRLQDVLQRCLQDVLKTYHEVKLFLLTRFQDVFEAYIEPFWDVLRRRLSTEGFAYVTLLRNLWSVYKICKGEKSFSFALYYTFLWLLTEAYLQPGRTSTMNLFLRK